MERAFELPRLPLAGALLTLLGATLGATCAPPPDVDGQPGGAQAISVGRVHADQLHCREGDCADWYRLRVEEIGDLTVRATTPTGVLAGDRTLVLVLATGQGRQLYKAIASGPQPEATIDWQSNRGFYMVRVEARDEERSALPYELALEFEPAGSGPPPPPPPPPAPPEPEFEQVQGEVLEIEGGLGNPEAVLIDRGERSGIRRGQTGRLLNGGQVIAEIRVTDTYPEGSRAKLTGSLSEPIAPTTRAEIDVPLERTP